MGYLVAGPLGALLATIAIFLPSFVLVGLVTRLAGWLRSRTWTAALLDGLNAAALGLMAGVSVELGRTSLVDPFTVGVALAALVLLWRTRLNSAWLVLGGAVVGLLESVVLA